MNRSLLKTALWFNLPSIAALIAIIIKAVLILPVLPRRVPMQFDFTGKPTTWGSPAGLLAAMLIPVLSIVVFNSVIYAAYAGFETRKKFGWYFLFTPFFTGFYMILAWSHLDFATAPPGHYHFPWLVALFAAIILTLTAALLEWFRPVIAKPENTDDDKKRYLTQWKSHIASQHQTGRFLYFESQDPIWSKYVITGLILVFLISGYFMLGALPGNAIVFWAITPFLALLYGGLGFTVDNRSIRVRLGILRLTLCKIRLDQIESVNVHTFSPLRDFGGWGIRYGLNGVWGFFITGNTGILIKTKTGQKILLGSDNPSRFAAFIESVLASPLLPDTSIHPRGAGRDQ